MKYEIIIILFKVLGELENAIMVYQSFCLSTNRKNMFCQNFRKSRKFSDHYTFA